MNPEKFREQADQMDKYEARKEFPYLHGEAEDPYAPAYSFNGFYIPNYMMGAIRRYVEQGIPPGDFLTAIITNNLKEAVSRADDINLKNLPAYVGYFYKKVPGLCWGSKQAMDKWIEFGGDMRRLLENRYER